MRQQFSNENILKYATSLQQAFLSEDKEIILPVKVNFYLQKNINTLSEAAQSIENSRMKIGERYGEYIEEEGAYIIKDLEKRKIAQKEMEDLLSIDQILEIYYITLEDLQDIKLTTSEMNALMFMINEE